MPGYQDKFFKFKRGALTFWHTRLSRPYGSKSKGPLVYDNNRPKDLREGMAYEDDRIRSEFEYVSGYDDDGNKIIKKVEAGKLVYDAPRKIIPDMQGGGDLVSENYPQSTGGGKTTATQEEANVPRQARGQQVGTITELHGDNTNITEFDRATANPTETPCKAIIGGGGTNETLKQPGNRFNARYPYNNVRLTESGHLFESDDTPDAERIKESHRMGTYYEILPDGTKVTKIVNDNFNIVVGDDYCNIQGSCNVTIEGDTNLYVKGNYTQQVRGNYELLVHGNMTTQVLQTQTNHVYEDKIEKIGLPHDSTSGDISVPGNRGGSFKQDVGGNLHRTVQGAVLENYKDNKTTNILKSESKTVALERVLTVRNTDTIVADKISRLCLGDHTTYVLGGKTTTITLDKTTNVLGAETTNITLDKTTNVLAGNYATTVLIGNKTQTVTLGNYTARSPLGVAEISGLTVQLNP